MHLFAAAGARNSWEGAAMAWPWADTEPPNVGQADIPVLEVTAPAAMHGRSVTVLPGRWSMGREADVVIDAPGVSREHAWLEWDGMTLWLSDLGSTNGTFLNGQRLDSVTQLARDDEIRLGDVSLRVRVPQSERSQTRPVEARDGSSSGSETTRLLCAAVYLDDVFREVVIDEVLDRPDRVAGPSYGVDQGAVLRHALTARWQLVARDTVLFVMLALAVVAWAAAVAGGAWGTRATLWEVALLLVAAWGVVSFERWWRFYRQLALGLSAWATREARPREPRSEALRRRLDEVDRQQSSNVVVFRNFLPFAGSGNELEGWAFAIDLEKGSLDPETGRRATPQVFSVQDLYAALTTNLQTIGLAGLRVEERIFIDDRDARLYPSLLDRTGADASQARDTSVSDAIRETNRGSARSYLACEVTGWRGQLVVTMFVRAMRLKGSLYLEWTATELLPLRHDFYRVDSLPRDPGYAVRSALARGAARTLPDLVKSPFRVFRHVSDRLSTRYRHRWQRELAAASHGFDLWSGGSLRELASGREMYRYFLGIDSDMYVKVVQLRVLKHILDFLKAHSVDTSDFAQQQQNINTSQTFVAGNVGAGAAVGAHARAGAVKTESAGT
jgi:hypothetical protein